MHQLALSQAYEGMILFKTAGGKSPRTIRNSRNTFKRLALFFPDDPPFVSITRAQLIAFFARLQEEYVSDPDGVAPRCRTRLSPKSVHSVYADLSVFWSWAVKEGFAKENIVGTPEPPAFESPVIEPLTREQLEAMIKACERSRSWLQDLVLYLAATTAHHILVDKQLAQMRVSSIDALRRNVPFEKREVFGCRLPVWIHRPCFAPIGLVQSALSFLPGKPRRFHTHFQRNPVQTHTRFML